jgi:ADP-ribose pyrophosphatase
MKKWKELHRELYFQKFSRKIEKVDFQMPDGSVSDFYVKKEGPAVATLALRADNQVILVEQFRPGPMEVLLELPGGYIDEGEDTVEAGARELREETGYQGEVTKVVECLDDAYSTMRRTVLVAQNCVPVSDQQLEADEYANVKLVSLEEFRNLLRSGKMTDVEVGYLALDYLNLL